MAGGGLWAIGWGRWWFAVRTVGGCRTELWAGSAQDLRVQIVRHNAGAASAVPGAPQRPAEHDARSGEGASEGLVWGGRR